MAPATARSCAARSAALTRVYNSLRLRRTSEVVLAVVLVVVEGPVVVARLALVLVELEPAGAAKLDLEEVVEEVRWQR